MQNETAQKWKNEKSEKNFQTDRCATTDFRSVNLVKIWDFKNIFQNFAENVDKIVFIW